MADQNNPHFRELFWFAVSIEFLGLLFLAALIWAPVPKENQTMATATFGFLTATVIAVPLSYLLGGNPAQAKAKDMKVEGDNNVVGTDEIK